MLLITTALFSCTVQICWSVRPALITLLESNTVVAEQNPTASFSCCCSAAHTHFFFGEFLEAILAVKTPTGAGGRGGGGRTGVKWQPHYCSLKKMRDRTKGDVD